LKAPLSFGSGSESETDSESESSDKNSSGYSSNKGIHRYMPKIVLKDNTRKDHFGLIKDED